MSRRLPSSLIVTLLVACVSLHASSDALQSQERNWYEAPGFWIATATNLAGIGLFITRVHAPAAAPAFGYATQAMGLPAAAFGVLDIVTGRVGASTIGLFAYTGWAFLSAIVDHVLQIEYREPVRPGILIPYVVTYYIGIGVLSATQLEHGTMPWIIAGSSCVLAVVASFYAKAKGAD